MLTPADPAEPAEETARRLQLVVTTLHGRYADLVKVADQSPRNAQFTSGVAWGLGALRRVLAAADGAAADAPELAFSDLTETP